MRIGTRSSPRRFVLAVVAATLIFSARLAADDKRGPDDDDDHSSKPLIVAAKVDVANRTIQLYGYNFGRTPAVWMDERYLHVESVSRGGTSVRARLPEGLDAGVYLVRVARSRKSNAAFDDFNVPFSYGGGNGERGPGPQGPQGPADRRVRKVLKVRLVQRARQVRRDQRVRRARLVQRVRLVRGVRQDRRVPRGDRCNGCNGRGGDGADRSDGSAGTAGCDWAAGSSGPGGPDEWGARKHSDAVERRDRWTDLSGTDRQRDDHGRAVDLRHVAARVWNQR